MAGDGRLACSTNDGVRARSFDDGATLWTADDGRPVVNPIAVNGDHIVAATESGGYDETYGIGVYDGATGHRRSMVVEDVDPHVAHGGFSIAGDVLYTGTRTGILAVGLDGERHWHRLLPDTPDGHDTPGALARPAVTDDAVVAYRRDVPVAASSVQAFNPTTGEEQWTADHPLPEPWRLTGQPVAGDGVVVVTATRRGGPDPDDDGTADRPMEVLLAMSTADGEPIGQWVVDGTSRGSPAIAGGTLVHASIGPARDQIAVEAVDVESWSLSWRYTASTDTVSAPSVTPNRVLVGRRESVVCLDVADGTERWTAQLPGTVRTTMVAGDAVYATYQDDRPWIAKIV